MEERLTLEHMIAWHEGYVDRLVKRGLTHKQAEETLDVGMGSFDYDSDPVDAADADLTYWSN